MRKLFAILLTLAMALSMTCSVFAANEYSGTEHNVQLLTPDSFNAIFSADEIDSITYNYSMQLSDSSTADVELDLSVSVGNTIYSGYATGTVTGNQVNNLDYIWEGALEGSIAVQDDFVLSVGFSRHNGTNAVQLCCVIQPMNVETGEIIAFVAGSITLREEITLNRLRKYAGSDIIEGNDMQGLNNPINPASVGGDLIVQEPGDDLGGSTYAYKGSVGVGFVRKPYSGTGCRTSAYFAPEQNRVAVCSTPYASNINDYYRGIPGVSRVVTELASIEYNLSRKSSNTGSLCNILHIDKPAGAEQGTFALDPLFEDIMGLVGVPTSMINAILDELSGRVQLTETYSICYSVKVSFTLGTSEAIAEEEQPIPLVFVLQKASAANYQGGTVLEASTQIRYRTAILFDSPYAWPMFFVTKTETATMEFEVTLT